MDHIDALERLHRLKEAGALSATEFAEQKARILDGATVTTNAKVSSPEPAERHAAIASKPQSIGKWAIAAIVGVCGLAGLAAWFGVSTPNQPIAAPSAVASDRAIAAVNVPAAISSLPETEQFRLASLAALGFTGSRSRKDGGERAITKPLKLLHLSFATVLLTSTEIPGGCHGCSGYVGVYYLIDQNGQLKVTGKWPKALGSWGWGAVPNWKLSNAFTNNPALVAEGGFTGQGYTCSGLNILELTPQGPVESDVVNTGMTNAGAVLEETGLTSGGDPLRSIDGKIVNIVKGRSFDVRVSGDENFVERYAKQGGKFVRVSGETKLGC